MSQEYSIVCDNKKCGYKIKSLNNDPNEDISDYLNMPCPDCGENLLTEEDYLQSLNLLRTVNWLNKWFSWIMFFTSEKLKKDSFSVYCHKGVKIENNDSK